MAHPDRFGTAMDPKTALQELAAALGIAAPVYAITDNGPDHSKVFTATVMIAADAIATGEGTSKKHAEMAAALEACTVLQARR
jgi:ribonuclease-3